ncbi:DUF2777 family protein [Geomicrobium sp. JSM 1781026]|uniref:DUF2777 family protein n=1 Tax=Geomicrobium sp. JSM 1781026 TaxID=3344580 RepID=UPI0035C248A5
MNRKEALQWQGKTVIFQNDSTCSYYGVLEEIHTPQNKIWTGTILVQGVHEIFDVDAIFSLKDRGGERFTISGNNIHPFDGKTSRSFRGSVLRALTNLENVTSANIQHLKEQKKHLQDSRLRFKNGHRQSEDPYLYFTLGYEEEEIVLIENSQKERMMLDGCPFDLEWYNAKHDEWLMVLHEREWKFKLKNGKKVRLEQGAAVRIHKEQFEPFQILLNELETPAKESLASILRDFGYKRKHLVKCHNTLLRQLLHAQEEQKFTGVNFLIFEKEASSIIIQHRYERILHHIGEDYVYDRFECTSDRNERQVLTYTNMQTLK